MRLKTEKTPGYIAEFEVQTTSKQRSILRFRLEAGRQLDDSVLSDALRRLAKMRKDAAFAPVNAMRRYPANEAAFKELRERHGFHQRSSRVCNCWLRDHLDVGAAQQLATRTWEGSPERRRLKNLRRPITQGKLESLRSGNPGEQSGPALCH